MGLRKYKRAIAKNRLDAMGVKSNYLGNRLMFQGGALRKKMKTAHGQRYLEYLRKKKMPIWRRVLEGDLAKDGLRAQLLRGQKAFVKRKAEKDRRKRMCRKYATQTN